MSQNLHILAEFVAKPDQSTALQTLLRGLIAPTRAEAGCIRYDLWQDRDNPVSFVLIEEWTDEPTLERHLATPHLQHALSRFPDLLAQSLLLRKFSLVD
jgi:quinol monooxygenase YgiN